jgi:hypothetical protein
MIQPTNQQEKHGRDKYSAHNACFVAWMVGSLIIKGGGASEKKRSHHIISSVLGNRKKIQQTNQQESMTGTHTVPTTLCLLVGWLDHEFLSGPRCGILLSVLLPSGSIVRGSPRRNLAVSCGYDNRTGNKPVKRQREQYEKGLHSDVKAIPWRNYTLIAEPNELPPVVVAIHGLAALPFFA